MRVIAAITGDSAAPAVLATAAAVADLFSAEVQALHVGSARTVTASQAAQKAGVQLRSVPGEVVREIVEAAESEDVAAVAIGARGTAAGRRPAGRTALAVIASLAKPVVVVAPGVRVRRPIRRVLVPLDGTPSSALALQEIFELATHAGLRVVVAHVHEQRAVPAFSDHLPHEVRAWSEEFLVRHCPAALDATLELRVGEPHDQLPDICRHNDCDLVALGWSQELGRGRAAVVRRMLAHSEVPVLLTPVDSELVRMPTPGQSPALAGADRSLAGADRGADRSGRPGSLIRVAAPTR